MNARKKRVVRKAKKKEKKNLEVMCYFGFIMVATFAHIFHSQI